MYKIIDNFFSDCLVSSQTKFFLFKVILEAGGVASKCIHRYQLHVKLTKPWHHHLGFPKSLKGIIFGVDETSDVKKLIKMI